MFYSHTFLARKGPLGTVWCAAHVQHRLKKSHYTATNIPSTVDRIMFPEVPIALRMSGHLLLGVVRIYSKKIEYLYDDYNILWVGICKAFAASTDVNLPKDATHAKSDDITLPSPSKFALDELDLDEYSPERFHDNHRKSLEDITLTDQIPIGRDPYIAVNISEDVPRSSTHLEDAPGSGSGPMDEDGGIGVDGSVREDIFPENISEHGQPHDAVYSESGTRPPISHNREEKSLHEDSIPGFEVMRNTVHSESQVGPPTFPDTENDVLEPDTVLQKVFEGNMDIDEQPVEEIPISGEKGIPQKENQEQQSPISEQGHDVNVSPAFALNSQENQEQDPDIGLNNSFVNKSVNLEILPSPPLEQPKRRRRKRLYDEKTVLTNKFMKEALEDASDLKRRKKDWSSSLEFWKLNNKKKQEKVFLEPVITGLCNELCNMFNKDYISSKDHLVLQEEAHPDPNVAQSPPPNDLNMSDIQTSPVKGNDFSTATSNVVQPSPTNDLDMEIEVMRNRPVETNNIGFDIVLPSPVGGNDFSAATSNGLGSHSSQLDMMLRSGAPSTFSGGSHLPEMETPSMSSGGRLGFENSALFDIPESDNSGGNTELSFLEEEEYTPVELRGTPEADYSSGKRRGTPEVDSLSVRARAVAQFLKNRSLDTPLSGEDRGDLSLNTILEGKRRKICARMFYETLVLKNCGLVDVKQDEAYGEIKLKVTPKLSKEQFSN